MEYGSRVLLGEALILSCWRGRESRGRRVESQEAAPAGTETQFPGRHTKRGRRCLPQAGESARGHERRDYEGVKGGAGHWGNRTLVRARGAGRWADRRRERRGRRENWKNRGELRGRSRSGPIAICHGLGPTHALPGNLS